MFNYESQQTQKVPLTIPHGSSLVPAFGYLYSEGNQKYWG